MSMFPDVCTCIPGEFSHRLGEPGCRYRIEPQNIELPNLGVRDPKDYTMAIPVTKAIQVNNDLEKMKTELATAKKALKEIIETNKDGDTIRIAMRGLGVKV